MQPDYIYCKYIIYIAFDNSNRYYLSFGIKFMRVWMFFVQEEKLRGVSVWNVREKREVRKVSCPGHENVTFVEIWSFLARTSVVKTSFLVNKIIELLR